MDIFARISRKKKGTSAPELEVHKHTLVYAAEPHTLVYAAEQHTENIITPPDTPKTPRPYITREQYTPMKKTSDYQKIHNESDNNTIRQTYSKNIQRKLSTPNILTLHTPEDQLNQTNIKYKKAINIAENDSAPVYTLNASLNVPMYPPKINIDAFLLLSPLNNAIIAVKNNNYGNAFTCLSSINLQLNNIIFVNDSWRVIKISDDIIFKLYNVIYTRVDNKDGTTEFAYIVCYDSGNIVISGTNTGKINTYFT